MVTSFAVGYRSLRMCPPGTSRSLTACHRRSRKPLAAGLVGIIPHQLLTTCRLTVRRRSACLRFASRQKYRASQIVSSSATAPGGDRVHACAAAACARVSVKRRKPANCGLSVDPAARSSSLFLYCRLYGGGGRWGKLTIVVKSLSRNRPRPFDSGSPLRCIHRFPQLVSLL